MTGDLAGVAAMAVLGLAVGSFLNVCIDRIPRQMSVVSPASHCPACGRPLSWLENVPVVAYLALRGRCRTCDAPIGVMHLLVELGTSVVFVVTYGQLGWQPLLAVRLVFCGAMVVLGVIDLRHRILPNLITLPGIVIGLGAALVLEPGFRSALIGVVVGGGGLFLLAEAYYRIRHEEGLGMGDVKMLAMIGAFLGWPAMLLTLFLASLVGSVVGVGMIVAGLGTRRYALPLGSFLAVAAIVAATWGEPIVDWYTGRYA